MKVVKGDLIKMAKNGDFDVIIHGCNCFCEMGAGIAKSIKENFPEAYNADLSTEKGTKEKLGTYSSATISINGKILTVVNAYTQHHWRGTAVKANYEAIKKVMNQVKNDFSGSRIGYPKIGAGLAGGDWEIISQIINSALSGEDHTLVEYVP
ncbi:MAG: macro domain-containing protein [Gammaproteobacteria bacterium]|nr:macro domain-containing protein [Gammaproteobacteria bacterium]